MKIDIEGHELKAFQGASESLRKHRIRDIVFEDYGAAGVRELLIEMGYAVMRIGRTFAGPRIMNGDLHESYSFDPPSSLATLDPERVQRRLRGWSILR
jgi:hypothetical protein